MMRNVLILLSLFSILHLPVRAQDSISLSAPFDFPLLLSGNFGELRSNHFHAGLDFKTQGVSGKPILVPCDGYISRATVSPGGYGRALYVMHDNGYMTVYGHLHRFPEGVAQRVREQQYSGETFAVDVEFTPQEFPVKRGEVLALAGNSGYSFGPHLHFEVRVAGGNELVNPMRFYKNLIKDTKAPVAQAVTVAPCPGKGVVEGGVSPVTHKISNAVVRDTISAWGTIGLSIKAKDVMNDTHNTYGVYSIEMYVDDSLRFKSKMDGYARDETRLINAWADYGRLHSKGDWFLKSYILDNNPLRILSADANRGWITIDSERIYNVEYRLADYHGNITVCNFALQGRCDTIPLHPDTDAHYLYWFLNNEISYPGMRLSIPRGELFENALLSVHEEPAHSSLSRRYKITGEYPLRRNVRLSIQVNDSLATDTSKLYIRRVKSKSYSSVKGRYSAGWMVADITQFGTYEVAIDTLAPQLKPINEKRWRRNGIIAFSIGDKETGIKDFKGRIDGHFVLFEYSSKNGRLTCDLRAEKIKPGRHKLQLFVSDRAGNTTTLEKIIII